MGKGLLTTACDVPSFFSPSFLLLGDVAFSEYFVPLSVVPSFYIGEYIVSFFLPGGV